MACPTAQYPFFSGRAKIGGQKVWAKIWLTLSGPCSSICSDGTGCLIHDPRFLTTKEIDKDKPELDKARERRDDS